MWQGLEGNFKKNLNAKLSVYSNKGRMAVLLDAFRGRGMGLSNRNKKKDDLHLVGTCFLLL